MVGDKEMVRTQIECKSLTLERTAFTDKKCIKQRTIYLLNFKIQIFEISINFNLPEKV